MSPKIYKEISSNFHFLIVYNSIDSNCKLVVTKFCQSAELLQVWHSTLYFRDRVVLTHKIAREYILFSFSMHIVLRETVCQAA